MVMYMERDLLAIIGSKNESKITGAVRALRVLGISRYKSVDIRTGVEQPIGFYETLSLALYRAEKALGSEGDLGIGIEGGILFDLGYPVEGQVAVVVDRDGFVSIGFSSLFPLPIHYKSLLGRMSLGEIMASKTGLENIGRFYGAIGYLSIGAVTRVMLSYESVLMALLPFIRRSFYKELLSVDDLKKMLKSREKDTHRIRVRKY